MNARVESALEHLLGQPFKESLGIPNVRHRRGKDATTQVLTRRLLSLDYLIERPGLRWLATEDDTVRRFEALGINRRNFPYRLYGPEGRPKVPRYFAFKLPIAVDDQAATFVYVDAAQRPQCSSSDSTQRSATAMDTSTAHGPNTETHDGSSMFAMETPSFTLVRPLSTRPASAQTTGPAMQSPVQQCPGHRETRQHVAVPRSGRSHHRRLPTMMPCYGS